MVDIISLARHLRAEFVAPEQYGEIWQEMCNQLGFQPDEETQRDAYQALVSAWNRAGWVFDDDVGAVMTEPGEEVVFDNDSVTITRVNGSAVFQFSLARGQRHDRVIWF